MESIVNFFSFDYILSSLFRYGSIILTLLIGIHAFKKITGNTGKLIGIGAMLKVISSLIYSINYLIPINLLEIFFFNSLMGRIGNILFLIGIFMLVKNLLIEQDDS